MYKPFNLLIYMYLYSQVFGSTNPDVILNDSRNVALGFVGLAVGAGLIYFSSVSSSLTSLPDKVVV